MVGRLALVASLAYALATAPAALAQRGEADAAFQRGRALMAQGQIAEACTAFETSMRLDPVNGTLYNLALCHERLGKLASAWSELRELATIDTNAARQKDAARRAAALEPRLTRMRLVVPPTQGLVIVRGDVDVTAFVGQTPPVDPGSYTFEARAPGYASATLEVALVGEGQTVDVKIPELAALGAVTGSAYPSQVALRPLILPRGRVEVSAQTVLELSSMNPSVPLDSALGARVGLGPVEVGAGFGLHLRYATRNNRPGLLSVVRGAAAYAFRPMLVAGVEYLRYHPTDSGATGSDLRAGVAHKLMLTPRIGLEGRAGFQFTQDEARSANELALVGSGHVHLIALRQVSVEVIAPVGLNLGGDLESHVVELGLAGRVLVALGDLDVYFEASTALLPDSSTQALLLGASWRVR